MTFICPFILVDEPMDTTESSPPLDPKEEKKRREEEERKREEKAKYDALPEEKKKVCFYNICLLFSSLLKFNILIGFR